MSSGGKGGKSGGGDAQQQLAAQQAAMAAAKPNQIPLKTTGWGGMGYNLPANPMQMGTPETGQGLTPPGWAQNDWSMDWWGKQAPNVGAAMLQQQGWGPYAQPQPGAGTGTGTGTGTTKPLSPWEQFMQSRSGRRGGKGHLVYEPNGASYYSILPQEWEQRAGIGVNPYATRMQEMQNMMMQSRMQGAPPNSV
jgi:hypothetical protein